MAAVAGDAGGLSVLRSRLRDLPRGPVIIVVAVVALAAAAGYLTGQHRTREVVLTGRAAVGIHEATIQVGGWYYGLRDTVAWIDANGTEHDDGWPACLQQGTRPLVRFAAIPVTLPDGSGLRDVVWVDCRT